MQFAKGIGIETYDPYDTKGCPLVIWTYARQSLLRKSVRVALYGAELFAPIFVRRLLRLPKSVVPGAVARMAQAHLLVYRLDGDDRNITSAEKLLRWLLDHPGAAPKGAGWGLPFDWQTPFGTVPMGTAVAHTTQGCGQAFLDYHEATGQSWAKGVAEECCDFLTLALNQTVGEDGSIALSYTPLDSSQVVNTNAESAAFLARCGRPADAHTVEKIVRFVVNSQSADGSWEYSADSPRDLSTVDHYHTGMVLDALLQLAPFAGTLDALRRGLDFHLTHHFGDDGAPKMRPCSLYPIDGYSAGESLMVLSQACCSPFLDVSQRDRARAALNLLVCYVIRHMAYPDGGFIYRKSKWATMRLDSLRWAQAILCHGLAAYCLQGTAEGERLESSQLVERD